MSQLNTLIPMEDGDGARQFVNQWDVNKRKADGWKVVGNIDQHTSTVKAPVAALDPANDPKPKTKGKPAAGGDGKTGEGKPVEGDPKPPQA